MSRKVILEPIGFILRCSEHPKLIQSGPGRCSVDILKSWTKLGWLYVDLAGFWGHKVRQPVAQEEEGSGKGWLLNPSIIIAIAL